jgi:hypothetical protein
MAADRLTVEEILRNLGIAAKEGDAQLLEGMTAAYGTPVQEIMTVAPQPVIRPAIPTEEVPITEAKLAALAALTQHRAGATGSWEDAPAADSAGRWGQDTTVEGGLPAAAYTSAPEGGASMPQLQSAGLSMGGSRPAYGLMGEASKALKLMLKGPRAATDADLLPYQEQAQALTDAQGAESRANQAAMEMAGQLQAQQLMRAKEIEEEKVAQADFSDRYARREARLRHSGADSGVSDEEIFATEQRAKAGDEAAKKKLAQWDDTDPFKSSVFGKTGGHILAAIAAAMGAYGATLGRTPNFAAQIIESAIDRSIAEMGQKRGAARDALEREYKMQMDKKSDLNQLKMLQFRGAQDILTLLQSQSASAEKSAKLQGMIAGIEQRMGELRTEGVGQTKVEVLDAAIRLAAIQEAANARAGALAMQNAPARSPIPKTELVDPALGTDKDSVKVAQKFIGQYNNARDILDQVIALRTNEGGPTIFNRNKVREGKALMGDYISALKEMRNYGAALSPSELRLITSGAPEDPTEFGYVLDQLTGARQRLDASVNQFLEPHNLRYLPAQVNAARLPEGGK